jgi:site-specific DNA recombinase
MSMAVAALDTLDTDPRFALSPAELVRRLAERSLTLDLDDYPDADTGLYARISLDRRDKTSVERQLEIAIAYAQEHRLPYVVFIDRGKSASRKGVVRRDYNAALDTIRARRLKRLVAYKIDRLYRQVEELMEVIKIADGGRVPVTLIGVDDEEVFDLTTGRGCDQAIGRVLEAQKESRRISERVGTERRKARERGLPAPGVRAFGWKNKTEHDEHEATLLHDAFIAMTRGESVTAIARRWNAAGVTTVRGNRWDHTALKRALSNPRNAGRLVHGETVFDSKGNQTRVVELVNTTVLPPIIDGQTFDDVQALLAERSQPLLNPRRRAMLTGIVRCERCQRAMVRTRRSDGSPLYRCRPTMRGTKACNTTINAESLDAFTEDALFAWLDNPKFESILAARRHKGSRRVSLQDELAKLKRRHDAMRKAMHAGEYDDDMDSYHKDIRDLGRLIRAAEDELTTVLPLDSAARWAGKGRELKAMWESDELDDDQRRAIIKDAFDRVTIHPPTRRGPRFDPDRVDFGPDVPKPASPRV